MTNLDQILKAKGITSQRLADMTKIPKKSIDNYRSGRREPSLRVGVKIADVLHIHPRELIDEKDISQNKNIPITDEIKPTVSN